MTDERDLRQSGTSDADLERRLGTRGALHALWNPDGRPITVSWNDSRIITADAKTRSRLLRVHSVIHAFLRNEPAEATARLTAMTSLMTVFTSLRSLTLASEVLWHRGRLAWREILAAAYSDIAAMAAHLPADSTHEALAGADAMRDAVWRNLTSNEQERILDCVANTARHQPPQARLGLGCFGAAVFASALKRSSGLNPDELTEEHAALLATLANGAAVTHRDGRLVVDD